MNNPRGNLTSRWTGGPYYLTPEQRRWTRELFERGVKQEKEKKAMKREKMKAEIGELIEELDRERMRQEFYKHLWPKGKWENGFCSLCGEEAITEWNETGGEVIYTNFCPSCGADMRGNKEEQSSSGPAKILYLCDRRRCDNCSGDCRLTSDIRHAENFIKYNDVFCEKEAASELIKEGGGESHETD